jgi:hypothetical protein
VAYFALIYELVDDYIARRGAFREQHLKLAKDSNARGELTMGGAFADPPDKATGKPARGPWSSATPDRPVNAFTTGAKSKQPEPACGILLP